MKSSLQMAAPEMCFWVYVDSKGQISQHIHAVCSVPSLSDNKSQWLLQNVWMESKGLDDLNLHILHVFEGTFSLNMGQITV